MTVKLDKYEKDILESYENDEWIEVPDMKGEIKKHASYAKSTIRKDKRVNIRMSQRDLESIQRKALEEGIPYQTLISSLLHKFVNGRLIEKNNAVNRK
jgi:predicted DNA binding CopG/RHH family protein